MMIDIYMAIILIAYLSKFQLGVSMVQVLTCQVGLYWASGWGWVMFRH